MSTEKACGGIRTSLLAAVLVLLVGVNTGCSSVSEEESSSIAKALEIKEGESVADVGAGDGVLLPQLAAWVGSEGRVFGTEIDPEKVSAISELAEELDLDQLVAIQGSPMHTGLKTGCCDAIVTRMVYHHFTDPEEFIDSLHESLRPGGRLLIIDFNPSFWMSSSAPDELPVDRKGQHGITPELVIREVSERGFALQTRFDDWPGSGGIVLNHFGLLFVRE